MADSGTSSKKQITFFYEKSPLSRAIRASGAFGSLTPDLGIHMALFSEHMPIPEQTTLQIGPDGQTVSEVNRIISDGVVRQIEVEAYLTAETAVALRDWLDDKIQAINKAKEEFQKAGVAN